jgi:hypothetical protein
MEVDGQTASLLMRMKTKVSSSAYNANSPYTSCVEDTSLLKAHGLVLVSFSAVCNTLHLFPHIYV